MGTIPTLTFVASNEIDDSMIAWYVRDLPQVARNPFTPDLFEEAYSADDNFFALQSILVDAVICALADVFVGNVCSTMSQYIWRLRLHWSRPYTSAMLIGGVQHAALLEA